MNTLGKKFNIIFLIFVSFIFFGTVFWLYQKHTVPNDSTISEWLINYQGGFTRRGIIGEISFQFAKLYDLNLRFTIFLFQSFIYLSYSILVYIFIKDVPKNILTVTALFSPLFLLYPLAELEVLARKEVFLFVGFIIFLILLNTKYSKNTSFVYIFFTFPFLILVWEPFIFFFPFPIFLLLLKNKDAPLKISLIKIFLSFSTSLFTIIYILLNLLTPMEHLLMEKSLMDNFNEICYMSCALLKSKSSINAQFLSVYNLFSFEVFFRYTTILLIGFLPLSILLLNTKLRSEFLLVNLYKKTYYKIDNIFLIFIFMLLPSLLLLASMTDWGRTINIMYTFSILTFIHLVKNNLVLINNNIIFFDKFYIHKKKLFVLLFVIFAFGWNPKTAITGDVATNSLYKILYNTSKKIFNFNGIRIFQNSPVIKFHKKYIE